MLSTTTVTGYFSTVARALWIAGCLAVVTPAQGRDSSEDNRNVLIDGRGDVVAVMVCDKNVPNKCLVVEPSSGNPLLMALRESDDRYFVVNYSTGAPVGRIVRVGVTAWRLVRQ